MDDSAEQAKKSFSSVMFWGGVWGGGGVGGFKAYYNLTDEKTHEKKTFKLRLKKRRCCHYNENKSTGMKVLLKLEICCRRNVEA